MGILSAQLRAPLLEAVLVSTKTGQSIKGVLREHASNGMVLSNASIASIDANGRVQWNALDGDVVVPMANIDYWQTGLNVADYVGEES
jgi:hypothetical protein